MSNKEFSQEFLKTIIFSKRKELGYSQQELSDLTGINRAMISKLEQGEYLPSIPQLLSLSNVLDFEINSLFVSDFPKSIGTLPAKKSLSQEQAMLVYLSLFY